MLALATILVASTTSTTTTTSKSSGSSFGLIIPLLVVVAAYLLFLRPRQQRAKRAQQAARTGYDVGDRVQSVGGIKGEVVDIDGDDVRVEVADGVVLTFTARAIQAAPGSARTPADDSGSFGGGPADDDGGYDGPDDEDDSDVDGTAGDVVEEHVVVPDDVDGIDFGDTSYHPDEGRDDPSDRDGR